MVYTHNGIAFALWKWQFIEDGYAGAIYFIVPKGTYKEGANNGASTYSICEAQDMADTLGIECDVGQGGQMLRVATPCLEHGESFEEHGFWFLIEEAAKWADLNLERAEKVTEVPAPKACFQIGKGYA
jgi:hypothetical protein